MRSYALLQVLLLDLLLYHVYGANTRALFLFKDVIKSNTTAIKTSGFNTVIIFGIGILENGDIRYYSNTPGSSDVVVASKGSYVGGDALAERVRSFKTGSTGIDRTEICMNSQHVKNLMASPGPGPETPLFKNFQALKAAWTLDAVTNNDEAIYDLGSTVAFGKMLANVGYKYTIAPYTRAAFWVSMKNQLNSGLTEANWLMDRVYLQCYDGGASNNPASWSSQLGMKIVPLIWVTNDSKPQYGTSAAQARLRFSGWTRNALAGGGYWNDFDIEKMALSYRDYGNVLTGLFP